MSRTRVYIILLAVVLAWAGWHFLAGDEAAAPEAAAGSTRASSQKGKDRITADKVPVVVSGLARPAAPEAFQRERNLFEFAQSPEELAKIEEQRRRDEEQRKIAAQKAAEEAAKRMEEDKLRRQKEAELAEQQRKAREQELRDNPPKPTPPSFPYQYVGTIGPVDAPFAILTGPDRAYRYVKAGEVVDSQFKLEYIAENRLDLSYVDPRFSDQFAQVQRQTDGSKSLR